MIPTPAEQPLAITPVDDEIDLQQVVGALGRRWPWIAGGGALGLVLSGLYLLTAKPVYQGEFQIVLNNQSGAGAASGGAEAEAPATPGAAAGSGSCSCTQRAPRRAVFDLSC